MKVPPFSLSKQISDLGSELEAAVLAVLRSGQYIGGQEVKAFETSFAEFADVPHVVGCNSGTDALILALRGLGIGSGDEVITSSFSFFATAEAISAVGARPVFVDVNEENYLMNLSQIEHLITPATKAILPVHIFGSPLDMEKLMELANHFKLKVVEDCAQSCGAQWKGRSLGSWGDIGCFSFFPTKNLGAAGDAGAITTKDAGLAVKIRELAVHGMPRRYLHTELGYNSRLDALQAAILNIKLPRLRKWIENRSLIAEKYNQALNDIDEISLPFFSTCHDGIHAWNQYVIRVKQCDSLPNSLLNNSIATSIPPLDNFLGSSSRDSLKERLQNQGVNTIIYYPIPIHLQPAYSDLGYQLGSLPCTEKLCNQVLSLPIFPEMAEEEQDYIIKNIRAIFSK